MAAPDQPTDLTFDTVTSGSANFVLRWTAPAAGEPVDHYGVGVILPGFTDIVPAYVTTGPVTSYQMTMMPYNVEYTFFVRAVAADGTEGEWSDPFPVTIPTPGSGGNAVDNTLLATVSELSIATKLAIPDDDEYALLMLSHASEAVRDYAERPGWVRNLSDPAVDGEEVAPKAARDITLWVAVRAFTNPRNLSRRTAGPISESFENGLWALELTPAEKDRLDGLPGSSTDDGGLWFLPVAGYGKAQYPIIVPTTAPSDPEFLMTPMQIATSGQLPWTTNPPADGGDVTYV